MIGAIRLSGSGSARWLRLSSLYLLGTTASGALLGTAVGTLGMVLSVSISLSPPDRMAAGVGLVGLLAVLDLVSRSQWAPGLHRQTDPRWRHQLGPGRAALLWGVELGMGVTTYRITSVFWAALVLVVLIGSPIVGALALGSYGLALWANWAIGQRLLSCRPEAHRGWLKHSRQLRRCLACGLVLWCVAMLFWMQVQWSIL